MKKILSIIGIIIVIAVAGLGYLIYKDLKQEEILKQEVIKLSNKDLLQDNFSIDIKTSGDYAYVENAIKKFYKELSDDIKTFNHTFDNDKLINILSLDNLQSDRPNFVNSRQVLSTVKDDSTKSLQGIATLCDEEYIKNLLDKEKVDKYYIDFYKKLMYTEQDLEDFKKIKNEMQELSDNLNLFLDKIEEILSMLEKNNQSWFVEDEHIYFDTDELVEQYNHLYTELKEIADEKLDIGKYSDNNVSV